MFTDFYIKIKNTIPTTAPATATTIPTTILISPQTSTNGQKHIFTCIKIHTCHISHTTLYNAAESTGLLKNTAFKALFYKKRSWLRFQKSSREFDELISKCVVVFGFKCYFVEENTKEPIKYVIIYNRHDNNENAINECKRDLNKFALKYCRHVAEYPIYSVFKLT